jgi:hypothetical protein
MGKKPDFSTNRSPVFHVPRIGGAISQANPLRSIGLGVHPSQVQEFNSWYRENGIAGAGHTPDGACILESRKARNEVLKLRGVRDNDAGYGDHSGNN